MPGDVVFILGGTLPILYLSVLGIRYMKKGSTTEEQKEEILFTEVVTPSEGR
jgi:nitric oxide reductase subunit B